MYGLLFGGLACVACTVSICICGICKIIAVRKNRKRKVIEEEERLDAELYPAPDPPAEALEDDEEHNPLPLPPPPPLPPLDEPIDNELPAIRNLFSNDNIQL